MEGCSNMRRKGFSLIELLIGISAAGIIGALLVGLLSSNSRIFSDQNTKVNQGLELNTASDEINETIKTAGAVVSQYPTTGQATYTTGLNTLVLSIPSINTQGTVIQNTSDYVVIHIDPQNAKVLRKRTFADPTSSRKNENRILSTKLSKIEFRYLDSADQAISPVQASKIGFIINVSDNVATKTRTSSASGQINLRNN